MSYILDALKKAEQERDLGRVPRLETVHDEAPHRARALPWLVAAVLLINAAALVWWLRPGARNDVATTARHASQPATPAPRIARVTPAPVAPAAPVPAPAKVVVTPPAAATPVTPEPRRPAVTKSVAPVTDVAPAPEISKPAASSVPLLRELPADFRATVPNLNLDVHVYSSSVTGRFVLINMKKYHEGDQLAEGPRIEAITEEGVVLNYQGQLFRVVRP